MIAERESINPEVSALIVANFKISIRSLTRLLKYYLMFLCVFTGKCNVERQLIYYGM